MNLVTALAVVIGALGAVATYLFLGPGAPYGLQIWAAFIGWGCFFHCGGDVAGLKTSIPAIIWGAVCATIALLLVVNVPIGSLPVTAAIWVGLSVVGLILAAQLPLLAAIPAAVYGYASTTGFALVGSHLDVLAGGAMGTNPFLTVVVSMIIGTLFGFASGKIAGMLVKK